MSSVDLDRQIPEFGLHVW